MRIEVSHSFENSLAPASHRMYELLLYTPEELAAVFGVTSQTIQAWRLKGTGPAFARLGKQVFYRREDVEVWIRRNVLHEPETEPVSETQGELFPMTDEEIAELEVAHSGELRKQDLRGMGE